MDKDSQYKVDGIKNSITALAGTVGVVASVNGMDPISAGMIPVTASFLADVIGRVIPNRKYRNADEYSEILSEKLDAFDQSKLQEIIEEDECVDLFEESYIQASRSLTSDRKEQIANIVLNGLSKDNLVYSETKYLLKIFEELNPQEVIWLHFISIDDWERISEIVNGVYNGNDFAKTTKTRNKVGKKLRVYKEEIKQKHYDILHIPERIKLTDMQERQRTGIIESYKEHLVRLKLVNIEYEVDSTQKDGYDIPFNVQKVDSETGNPIVKNINVSPVGRLLLEHIGLWDLDIDFSDL